MLLHEPVAAEVPVRGSGGLRSWREEWVRGWCGWRRSTRRMSRWSDARTSEPPTPNCMCERAAYSKVHVAPATCGPLPASARAHPCLQMSAHKAQRDQSARADRACARESEGAEEEVGRGAGCDMICFC